MPLPWTPRPTEIIQSWIDAINDEASDSLTDWESNFIESIQNYLDARGHLTQSQEETLERIYAQKTN